MSEYRGQDTWSGGGSGHIGGRIALPDAPRAATIHPPHHHDLHPWMSVVSHEFDLWREGLGYERPYYRNYSWCGAFAGWVMRQAGYTHLPVGFESAANWRHFGMKLQHPQYGCICVLNDGILDDPAGPGNPWYHVTFFSHRVTDGGVFVGGNQGGRVKPSTYDWNGSGSPRHSQPRYEHCEWRWPVGHSG